MEGGIFVNCASWTVSDEASSALFILNGAPNQPNGKEKSIERNFPAPVEISNFVEWSLDHVFQICECCSDEEEWNLLEWSISLPWDQIQETEVLHSPEEEDQSNIEEESSSVGVTCKGNKVHKEGGPELDTQGPGNLNKRH